MVGHMISINLTRRRTFTFLTQSENKECDLNFVEKRPAFRVIAVLVRPVHVIH